MNIPSMGTQSLPSIHVGWETARLAFGYSIRLCLSSLVYYGVRGLVKEKLLHKKDSLQENERGAVRYVTTMSSEMLFTCMITPTRYLAAVNTPRFLFDFLLTNWSENLARIDGFRPGRYASYAIQAFASSSDEDDWNMDFFAWQMPCVVLALGRLYLRRRLCGPSKTKPGRVLWAIAGQVLLRTYMTTFSVMLPETGSELIEAVGTALLEGALTSYIVRATWPLPAPAEKKEEEEEGNKEE